MKTIMRVECIKAYSNHRAIAVGNQYDVYDTEINPDLYFLQGDDGSYYYIDQDHFVVKQTFNPFADDVKATKEESEEEKCQRLLKPTILSHECPCGITRKDCVYHN